MNASDILESLGQIFKRMDDGSTSKMAMTARVVYGALTVVGSLIRHHTDESAMVILTRLHKEGAKPVTQDELDAMREEVLTKV